MRCSATTHRNSADCTKAQFQSPCSEPKKRAETQRRAHQLIGRGSYHLFMFEALSGYCACELIIGQLAVLVTLGQSLHFVSLPITHPSIRPFVRPPARPLACPHVSPSACVHVEVRKYALRMAHTNARTHENKVRMRARRASVAVRLASRRASWHQRHRASPSHRR